MVTDRKKKPSASMPSLSSDGMSRPTRGRRTKWCPREVNRRIKLT